MISLYKTKCCQNNKYCIESRFILAIVEIDSFNDIINIVYMFAHFYIWLWNEKALI